MPIDLSELTRMVTAGALVAAAAVPAGLVALALRGRSEPLLPHWKPLPVPWSGFEVTAAFIVVMFVIPISSLSLLENNGFYQIVYGDEFPRAGAVEGNPEQKAEATTLRTLWANLLALPLVLGALALTRLTLYSRWHPPARGSVTGKVALAVLAWLLVAPAVLLLNAVVNAVATSLDVPPDTHSLAKLGSRPALDRILLVLEACVGAPLREELLIRGALLWWCVGRLKLPGLGVTAPTSARPWFVLGAGVILSGLGGKWQPLVFAAVLTIGLIVLYQVKRTGARRARAVYATAAFFALMHPVWPNPVALFALGLALGYLSVRTNGLLVPVLVHALFNAVSVVFVLRG